MPTSPYISWFRSPAEQSLQEDLIVETIKLYGYDIVYMPRSSVRKHDIFAEDILQSYKLGLTIECYIQNIDSFQGEGDIFAASGYAIQDQITFTIARRRWDELAYPFILTDEGYVLARESAVPLVPGVYDGFLQDVSSDDEYDITQPRPFENDLIYFPLVKKLFVIRFVEHEEMFYPLGRLQVYQLRCEMWDSSSETIDTGMDDIDMIEDAITLDTKSSYILTDDNQYIMVTDENDYLLQDDFRIENVMPSANNELFQVNAPTVVDFSERNPFLRGSGKY